MGRWKSTERRPGNPGWGNSVEGALVEGTLVEGTLKQRPWKQEGACGTLRRDTLVLKAAQSSTVAQGNKGGPGKRWAGREVTPGTTITVLAFAV